VYIDSLRGVCQVLSLYDRDEETTSRELEHCLHSKSAGTSGHPSYHAYHDTGVQFLRACIDSDLDCSFAFAVVGRYNSNVSALDASDMGPFSFTCRLVVSLA